jgi:phosphoribosylanthranilate isomerase
MTRVKVCGLTRAGDVDVAVGLGAWAVGVVLSASPRRVASAAAARLLAAVPASVLTVGVFTTEAASEIAAAAALAGVRAVQLSAGADGPGVAAVRAALRARGATLATIIAAADTIDAELADYVLLDSRLGGGPHAGDAPASDASAGDERVNDASAGYARTDDARARREPERGGRLQSGRRPAAAATAPIYGGTGRVLDWQTVRVPAKQSVMLAGGITADNVGAAIAAVRPFAVDVSSGVELAPGKKDARLLERLFAAVRAADDADKTGHDQR